MSKAATVTTPSAGDVLKSALEYFGQSDGDPSEPFRIAVDVRHDSGQEGTVFFGYEPKPGECPKCGGIKTIADTSGPVHVAHDDGEINLTFGAGITVGDLAEALGNVSQDAMLGDLGTTHFCGADDCEGSDVPDETHDYFVTTLTVWP